jgi:5-formyltetrahydrofolate cyclo-ligase
MTKPELRAEVLRQRKLLLPDAVREASDIIVQSLLRLPEVVEASSIMLYLPLQKHQELDITGIMNHLKAEFYVPVVRDGRMFPCSYKPGKTTLHKGAFGVMEPVDLIIPPKMPHLVICPGLACDVSGGRLGYGKGYYDRYLSKNSAKVIFPIMEVFVFPEIPVDEFDVKADVIVTERRVMRIERF